VSSDVAFLCLTAANLFAVIAIVAGGALSDIVGRKPVMVASSLAMLAATLAYFPLLQSKAWLLIFAAMAAFLGALQVQSGVQPALFAESFPTRVRYSGSAAAYTGANLVAAGPAPFVAAWLLAGAGGQTWSITAACVAVVVISLIAILCTPETRHAALNR
jgi:MFS family permease